MQMAVENDELRRQLTCTDAAASAARQDITDDNETRIGGVCLRASVMVSLSVCILCSFLCSHADSFRTAFSDL